MTRKVSGAVRVFHYERGFRAVRREGTEWIAMKRWRV